MSRVLVCDLCGKPIKGLPSEYKIKKRKYSFYESWWDRLECHDECAMKLINALDDVPIKEKEFIEWVIEEIMDEENWELNCISFPEIACRKLVKMGYLKIEGEMYKRRENETDQC